MDLKQVDFATPLVNPVTVVSMHSWLSALNYAAGSLQLKGHKVDVNQPLRICFKEFYVATDPIDSFDFDQAQAEFTKLFQVQRHVVEPNDRDDEVRLTMEGVGLMTRFYEFKGLICFSVGSAQHMDGLSVLKGRFQFPPTETKMSGKDFLRFLEILETVFLRRHQISQVRVLMAVRVGLAAIVAKAYFSEHRQPDDENVRGITDKTPQPVYRILVGKQSQLESALKKQLQRY